MIRLGPRKLGLRGCLRSIGGGRNGNSCAELSHCFHALDAPTTIFSPGLSPDVTTDMPSRSDS